MVEANLLEQSLFHIAIGNNRYALELAEQQGNKTVKAQALINLGRYQEAADSVEGIEDVYARLVFAKALFFNGEFERAIIEVQKLKEAKISNQTES